MTTRPRSDRLRRPLGPRAVHPPRPATARVLVLYGEGDPPERLLELLRSGGYEVETASSDTSGLERSAAWGPDVVVLDTDIETRRGIEVMERLKEKSGTALIPVLFLTDTAPPEELVIRGLELGACAFVGKGGSKGELLARVAAMVRIKRGQDELAAFARVSDALLQTLEPSDLLPALVEQTRAVFRADAALLLFHTADHRASLAAGARVDPKDPLCARFSDALLDELARRSADAAVIRTRELPAGDREWMVREGYQEVVAARIRRGDGRATVLLALSRRADHFRPAADPRLLESLGRHASIPLENALLHAEMTRQAGVLREQTEKLERAMAERSRFFAAMSHEIRTPINAVIGYNQLLQEGVFGELNPGQRDAAENVGRSARHLLHLINDILDVSKIEAGKIEISREPVDLAELVRYAVTSVRLQAEEKGLSLEIHGPRSLVARTDRARVRQIVLNLLSNAVKFTEEGGVTAELAAASREGGSRDAVRIRIADTGPGIAASDRERIFEEFEQAERVMGQRGTGLGLPISRKLAQLLDGELTLESEPGEGSTFTLELPLKPEVPPMREEGSGVAPLREDGR